MICLLPYNNLNITKDTKNLEDELFSNLYACITQAHKMTLHIIKGNI